MVFGLHRLFFIEKSSRKQNKVLLFVLFLCYNRTDVMRCEKTKLEVSHVKTKL